ncbi:MAG TPA: PH domain-containing protein [Actinomycetes bacterium]|nr:PH domain-containing protein [Actinomycetes bacterium]
MEAQTAGIRLRAPANRVSRTAVWYWATRAGAAWLVVLAAQLVWIATDPPHLALHAAALATCAVLAAAHLLVMPRWRYHVHRWEATDGAVYTQSGWFTQERRLAPISRIQTVDSHRGPLEQLFRLTNVTVTTASAAGPLVIEGLDLETAESLVARLTAAAEASAGDAT